MVLAITSVSFEIDFVQSFYETFYYWISSLHVNTLTQNRVTNFATLLDFILVLNRIYFYFMSH